jgi:RNA polymerase sigma factor (sigma-70 family)
VIVTLHQGNEQTEIFYPFFKPITTMKSNIHLSDLELVTLFKQGDIPALELLINRYKDKLFTSIMFLVKDKYLAEDIFQDVFIKAIETIRGGRYNEEGKFLPWVMRIAHNLCIDHFRKVKRSPSITTGNNENLAEMLPSTDSSDSRMIKQQSHESVRRMIDLLPYDQREVIILRHYAELSFKEIANLTNCSINTALGRMRYGLINLRKMMTEKQIAL